MNIAICDDNQQIISQILFLLKKYFNQKNLQVPTISTFFCGEDLLSDPFEKDIVFLDIEMPGCDGIFVGNTLKQKWVYIYFLESSFYIIFLLLPESMAAELVINNFSVFGT